ncbi:glycosyltransferase family 4 protein [Dyadobacter sp. 676]|uniref:Glycosyltransferase family 4 protein n=1 Tax=Dyadobacter sp. 676 TaxID=3088362 RepID=A0AAU8FN30_9BACT
MPVTFPGRPKEAFARAGKRLAHDLYNARMNLSRKAPAPVRTGRFLPVELLPCTAGRRKCAYTLRLEAVLPYFRVPAGNSLAIRKAFLPEWHCFLQGGVCFNSNATNMDGTSAIKPRLKIFTWHIHGSYLYYLSQGNYDIYIPVNQARTEGYYGRGKTFPFGANVIEVPAAEVRNMEFDCILFQSERNFLIDQHDILSDVQKRLPRLYVEHNTPERHPTNTRHVMTDPAVTLVHVTHFNKLMWDNGGLPHVRVIEHGVCIPEISWKGDIPKGIVVINHIQQRGRITGWDVFEEVRKHVPIDLIGMGTEESGGLGEVLNPQLPGFISRYRFFFNPIRYTSFGLAVCEAMMTGMPVVAMATTEYVTVIKDGESGFIDTNPDKLIEGMRKLIDDPGLARRMGENARRIAGDRFAIGRFTSEWETIFRETIQLHHHEKENSIY